MELSLKQKMENKRDRKRNFSMDETRILREEFEKNKDVLESKLTNTVTNSRKNEIWKAIVEKINSLGCERRTTEEVKNKWRNICSSAKCTWNTYKRERLITGGGTPPKPPSEEVQKVIDIFEGQPRFEGLQGFSSFKNPSIQANSDAQLVPTFEESSMNPTDFMINDTSASASYTTYLRNLSETLDESLTPPLTSTDIPCAKVPKKIPKKIKTNSNEKGKKRKISHDVTETLTEIQINALIKKEHVIQGWKIKNLKLQHKKFEQEKTNLELQEEKLQLEIALLRKNLRIITGIATPSDVPS